MWNFHCVYLPASFLLHYPSPFPSPWSVIRGTSTMLASYLTLLLTLFSDQDLASVELLWCQVETVSLLCFSLSIPLVSFMQSSVSTVCATMHHCLCCNIIFWTARWQDQTCGSLEREIQRLGGEGENTSLLRIAGPVEKWTKVPIGLSQSFVWKKALTCGDGGLCAKRAEKG